MSPWQAIDVVWDVLFAIAIPTIIFALGGTWFDKHFGTTPIFSLIGLGCALVVTIVLMIRKAKALKSIYKK